MSGDGNVFSSPQTVSDFFSLSERHRPNHHEQKVKDTDAPMPGRPIANTRISVVQGKERRAAKGTATLIRV